MISLDATRTTRESSVVEGCVLVTWCILLVVNIFTNHEAQVQIGHGERSEGGRRCFGVCLDRSF